MLAGLVDELRSVGIAVSVGEHVDAAQALSAISLQDKEAVRAALQCALVKNAEELEAFDVIFDLYTAGTAQAGADLVAAMSDAELRDTLRAVIGSDDAQVRRLLADEYVRRFGGLEPGRAVAGVFAQIHAEAAAGLGGIRAELLADQAALDEGSGAGGGSGGGSGGAGAGGGSGGSGGLAWPAGGPGRPGDRGVPRRPAGGHQAGARRRPRRARGPGHVAGAAGRGH